MEELTSLARVPCLVDGLLTNLPTDRAAEPLSDGTGKALSRFRRMCHDFSDAHNGHLRGELAMETHRVPLSRARNGKVG